MCDNVQTGQKARWHPRADDTPTPSHPHHAGLRRPLVGSNRVRPTVCYWLRLARDIGRLVKGLSLSADSDRSRSLGLTTGCSTRRPTGGPDLAHLAAARYVVDEPMQPIG